MGNCFSSSSSNLHAAVFGAGSLAVLGAEFDSFSLVAPEHKHPYKRHARHERGRGGGGGGGGGGGWPSVYNRVP